jgi:hypothetical protein
MGSSEGVPDIDCDRGQDTLLPGLNFGSCLSKLQEQLRLVWHGCCSTDRQIVQNKLLSTDACFGSALERRHAERRRGLVSGSSDCTLLRSTDAVADNSMHTGMNKYALKSRERLTVEMLGAGSTTACCQLYTRCTVDSRKES